MLGTRVATGVVLGAVLVAAVLYGRGWPFFLLTGVAVALCAREYFAMFFTASRDRRSGEALTVLAYAACALLPLPFAAPAVLLCVLLAAFHVFPGDAPPADRLRRAALLVLGVVYIGGFLGMYPRVRALPAGAAWVLFGLVVVTMGDTFAYFAGRAFGARPLSPLSPKKTVEGTAGGLAASVAFGATYAALFLPAVPVWYAAAAGAALGAIGQGGDLFESMLKRAVGVKDSGTLLPGHGGMFDRADSVIAVGPALHLAAELSRFVGGGA